MQYLGQYTTYMHDKKFVISILRLGDETHRIYFLIRVNTKVKNTK